MPGEDVLKFTAGNGDNITLRLAGCQDAEELINVIRTDAPDRSYVLMEHYGTKANDVIKYICSMNFEKNLLIVAASDREIVGALSGIQMHEGSIPRTAHILNIGLHIIPSCRGFGIGSKMLDFAVSWAKDRGFKKLEANIFTTNRRSLHLFERAGFMEEGIRRKRIRIGKQYIDEVLVGKIL